MRDAVTLLGAMAALTAPSGQLDAQAPEARRPMTFLDVQLLRSAGNLDLSPDGSRALYTLSVPDWKEARSTTDIYLVPVDGGVAGTRRMTFTSDKSESNPTWGPDGSFFIFSSAREGVATGSRTPETGILRRWRSLPGLNGGFGVSRGLPGASCWRPLPRKGRNDGRTEDS